MTTLQIADEGLLIPRDWLDGLPAILQIRRVKDGLIIESERISDIRNTIQTTVNHLRATVANDTPNEAEIRELVDVVRTEHAGHH